MTAVPDEPVEKLRAICLGLPETTERLSHGEPAWFIRSKKSFVTFADHHHDDRVAFWCAAPEGAHEVLVGGFPDRFLCRHMSASEAGWASIWMCL